MTDWVIRNAEFIGFVGTLFFTLWVTWAAMRQIALIWKNERVQSLSLDFAWYSLMYFTVRLAYGLDKALLPVVIHAAIRLLVVVPFVISIFKFHAYSRWDWIRFCSIMAILPIALLQPDLDTPFLVLSLVGVSIFFHQPYSIFRNRNAGIVEIRVYIVSTLNVTFWIIYSLAVNDLNILVPSIIGWVGNAITIGLILKYPRQSCAA